MEPRPNKPTRGSASPPPESSFPSSSNPIYSGGDSASWATSAWTSPSNPSPNRAEPTPRTEPLTARAEDWHGQLGAYAPGSDQGYSPGPSLAPIDQRRGSSWLGPLIAIAVLALIVAAVAVAFTKARGGGDNRAPTAIAQIAGPARTSTAQAALQTQVTATPGGETPTAKASAAAAPTKAATTEAKATVAPDSSSSGSTSSSSSAAAKTLLPTIADVGPGFVVTEYDNRDKSAVAQSFGDPNDAATKLKQWGWKENVFTTFEIPAADATDPNATTYMNVSIHRFSNADGAAAAFTYFSDAVVAAQHMTDVTVDKIGDQTRELSVKSTDSNLAVVYIRSGNYLIRIGASSPTGNPSADILALAKKVVK